MCIIFASLILVTWFYESKNDEYENLINEKNKSLNSISLSRDELEEENKDLYKKIEELEEEKELLSLEGDSKYTTYYQSMIDLSDISHMIKQGNIKGAEKELLKIDTNGYDFTALSFYESLCRELGIEIK